MITKQPFNMLIYNNQFHANFHNEYSHEKSKSEQVPETKIEYDYSYDQSSSNSSSTRYFPSPFFYNLVNGTPENYTQLTLSNDLLYRDTRQKDDIFTTLHQNNKLRPSDEFEVEPLHLMWFSTTDTSNLMKYEAPTSNAENPKRKRSRESDFLSEESRSSKGLRILSLKVKDIVCEKKQSTYKEIAECLISTLELKREKAENGYLDIKGMAKDEQNIKRRVYDALNVLISAGILKKKGKIVYSDSFSSLQGEKVFKRKMEEKQAIMQKLAETRDSVNEKRQKMKNLKEKYNALNYLVERNMKESKSIAVSKSAEQNEQMKIRFPFVILEMKKKTDTTIEYSKKRDFMKIVSKHPFKITGDIDSLLKLKMNECSFDKNSASLVSEGIKIEENL